jgi:hypothetical protein
MQRIIGGFMFAFAGAGVVICIMEGNIIAGAFAGLIAGAGFSMIFTK